MYLCTTVHHSSSVPYYRHVCSTVLYAVDHLEDCLLSVNRSRTNLTYCFRKISIEGRGWVLSSEQICTVLYCSEQRDKKRKKRKLFLLLLLPHRFQAQLGRDRETRCNTASDCCCCCCCCYTRCMYCVVASGCVVPLVLQFMSLHSVIVTCGTYGFGSTYSSVVGLNRRKK